MKKRPIPSSNVLLESIVIYGTALAAVLWNWWP